MKLIVIVFAIGFIITAVRAQEPVKATLRGKLTRPNPTYIGGSSPDQAAPNMAADAAVSLCFTSTSAQGLKITYVPILTTISDADGQYALFVEDDLDITKTYVLRIRPIDGEWETFNLGPGSSKAEWLKEFDVALPPWMPSGIQVAQGANNGDEQATRPVKQVIFATDRNMIVKDHVVRVTNDVGADELRFGLCNVVLDEEGTQKQSLIEYFVGKARDKYYSVDSISPLSDKEAGEKFAKALRVSSKRDSLLFIHGYNTSFNDACRRAAQIAYDTKFRGPIFLYSWASNDNLLGYEEDEFRIKSSAPLFVSFLKRLLETKGINNLHVIAHSMGNRLLLSALSSQKLSAADRAHLGHLVFAAPDVIRSDFEEQTLSLSSLTSRATLYASGKDQALQVSIRVRGPDRAGYSKPEIETRDGMDSIDATAVDVSLLGHSYIGNSRSVLVDLAQIILYNVSPERRVGLVKRITRSKTWWAMTP